MSARLAAICSARGLPLGIAAASSRPKRIGKSSWNSSSASLPSSRNVSRSALVNW